MVRDVEQLKKRIEDLEAALTRIADQQPRTIGWLRDNGIVFDGPLGTDPGNWQHVAFSIYTDLCEVDSIARGALSVREELPQPGQFSLYDNI